MFFEIVGKADDLLALVFVRNGNENGLVKAAANELGLAALRKFYYVRIIFRALLLDPSMKRPGIVETETNAGMLFQVLDEGQVARLVGLFKNVVEIAAGLMGVDEQGQVKFLGNGDGLFSGNLFSGNHDNAGRDFMNCEWRERARKAHVIRSVEKRKDRFFSCRYVSESSRRRH